MRFFKKDKSIKRDELSGIISKRTKEMDENIAAVRKNLQDKIQVAEWWVEDIKKALPYKWVMPTIHHKALDDIKVSQLRVYEDVTIHVPIPPALVPKSRKFMDRHYLYSIRPEENEKDLERFRGISESFKVYADKHEESKRSMTEIAEFIYIMKTIELEDLENAIH